MHPLDSHRTHGEALPCALREEHFDTIRANLDRLTVEQVSVEEFVERSGPRAFDRFNLSDLFEYVSLDHYHRVLASIVRASRKVRGSRAGTCSRRDDGVPTTWRTADPLASVADRLHRFDRAFFYSALRVEEVR